MSNIEKSISASPLEKKNKNQKSLLDRIANYRNAVVVAMGLSLASPVMGQEPDSSGTKKDKNLLDQTGEVMDGMWQYVADRPLMDLDGKYYLNRLATKKIWNRIFTSSLKPGSKLVDSVAWMADGYDQMASRITDLLTITKHSEVKKDYYVPSWVLGQVLDSVNAIEDILEKIDKSNVAQKVVNLQKDLEKNKQALLKLEYALLADIERVENIYKTIASLIIDAEVYHAEHGKPLPEPKKGEKKEKKEEPKPRVRVNPAERMKEIQEEIESEEIPE